MELETNSSQRTSEPEPHILYVVGTPIGNLKDISERGKSILSKVSLIACEDTRRTKKLLNALKIKNKLFSFNEYNSKDKTDLIIKKLKEGSSVALVSDAGLPGISDPGEYLINTARKNNLDVICSPGPCAALTGLVSSGLSCKYFSFIGFVPKKGSERENCFKMISENDFTIILYESPKRIKLLLKDLNKYCEGERIVHIAKELTKKYETHWNGSINKIASEIGEIEHKGEFTIIIEGKRKTNKSYDLNLTDLKKDLDELIKLGLKRALAANYLAKKNGIPKNIIYNL